MNEDQGTLLEYEYGGREGEIPDHGHLERRFKRELGEQKRVISEFGTHFWVQKLLANG